MTRLHQPRFIAFYLPQYHPIPENDEWWGKGFTEWTNVAKAKPLFKGHHQPHLPADLGYYDLRVPEVRQAQADLAREHGIEGFCYWHYWFAGKRLLERPFNEVLQTGKPDFPFCLAWANETWSGIWHGNPEKILIEQTYPGVEDHERHFYEVLKAFKDPRYITVEGKPVFVIFRPRKIPDLNQFIELWRKLAIENGLSGIYFIGNSGPGWDYHQTGLDAVIIDGMTYTMSMIRKGRQKFISKIIDRIFRVNLDEQFRKFMKLPLIISYKDIVAYGLPPLDPYADQYPVIYPNWDNTPRSGVNGIVVQESTPDLFNLHLSKAIQQVEGRVSDKRLIFIKSWNEWAEGNYLEPDSIFSDEYLRIINRYFDNT